MSGTRGPISGNEKAPLQYEAGRPLPPNGLTDRGREIFEWACDQIEDAGALQVVDGAAVGKYAQWLDMWEREIRTLNVETAVIVVKLEVKTNPRLTAVKHIDTMLSSAEKKLGFSPEDRMRISGGKSKKANPLMEALDKKA